MRREIRELLFSLARRPVLWILAAVFLFFPFLGVLFFTEAAPTPPPASFAEEKEALTAAWEKAKEDYENLSPGEDLAQPRQRILFYETALRFEMAVWSSDFLSEAASLYAQLIRELEILRAYPKEETALRKAYLEEKEPILRRILQERDDAGYLEFLEEKMRDDGVSEDEIRDAMDEAALRIRATLRSKMTPAKSLAVARCRALQKSLREGVNAFDPAYEGQALSDQDREIFKALEARLLEELATDSLDPVPANTETVFFFEGLGAILTLVLLLSLTGAFKKEPSDQKSLPALLAVLLTAGALFSLVYTLSLALVTRLFAPGSLVDSIFFLGEIHSLPFLLSLILRALMNLVSLMPWMLLALYPLRREHLRMAQPVLILLAYLLYDIGGIVARLDGGKRTLTPYLPFVHTDLAGAFFPRFPLDLAVSRLPLFSLALVLALTAGLIFLVDKKRKKEA